MDNKEFVKSLYDAFAKGDVPTVLGGMAEDIVWTEAEGGPYGGVFRGPQNVLENVFMKLGGDWDGFSAVPKDFIAEGDKVVTTGEYGGTFKETGKELKTPFAHVWTIKDGRVTNFVQHVDTVLHLRPMS